MNIRNSASQKEKGIKKPMVWYGQDEYSIANPNAKQDKAHLFVYRSIVKDSTL